MEARDLSGSHRGLSGIFLIVIARAGIMQADTGPTESVIDGSARDCPLLT